MPKSNIRFIEIAVRIVCAVSFINELFHFKVYALYPTFPRQVACAGAVVAGAFSINKIIDINNNQLLAPGVDFLNDDLRQRTEAAAALTVAAGIIIPLEIIMVFLRLFKIKLGSFGRILAILVILN